MSKYIVFEPSDVLAKSELGYANICYNPLTVLRNNEYDLAKIKIFEVEQACPIMNCEVRISQGKVFLPSGSVFGVKQLDTYSEYLIIVEPSGPDGLKTGNCRALDKESIRDTMSNDSFLVLSIKEGPKKWTRCVYVNDELDWGDYLTVIPLVTTLPSEALND